MTEADARSYALAAILPAVIWSCVFTVFYWRLSSRLRSKFPAVSKQLEGSGGQSRVIRLLSWVGAQSYLSLGDPETVALGRICRGIYRAMFAVAIWMAAVMVVGGAR